MNNVTDARVTKPEWVQLFGMAKLTFAPQERPIFAKAGLICCYKDSWLFLVHLFQFHSFIQLENVYSYK